MQPSRLAPLAALMALAAACGGSTGSSSFEAAAPSFSAISMDLTAQDASAPTLLSASSALTAQSGLTLVCDDWHPHLFVRTHDVVARVNRHLWRALRHAENAIQANPTLATGAEQVWERVRNDIDVKFTMTRSSDVVFTWKLEMKKVTDAAFTTVVTGSIDRTNAQGKHQGVGDVTIDLSNLAGVTGEDVAGVLAAHFETFTASRKLVVDAQNVVWDTDANAAFVRAPRSAHYVYDREPGKGGSLKIEEQMVFACPANPDALAADVKLVSRWYHTALGDVHGRSDALMTGGQLAADQKFVGVTCHDSQAEGEDQAESFWLLKLEDQTGATVQGNAHESSAVGASACDAVFGAVPSLTDAASDFDMSGIDFSDASPYPFPGI